MLELTNSAQFNYTYFSLNVTGTNNDYLRFRERNGQGFYNLDDVAVQLCPGCGLDSRKRGPGEDAPDSPVNYSLASTQRDYIVSGYINPVGQLVDHQFLELDDMPEDRINV